MCTILITVVADSYEGELAGGTNIQNKYFLIQYYSSLI